MHSGIVARRNAKLDCIVVNGVDQIHRYNRITGLTADNCELRLRGEARKQTYRLDVSECVSHSLDILFFIRICRPFFLLLYLSISSSVGKSFLFLVVIECISATVLL